MTGEVSKIAYIDAFGTQKRLPTEIALEKWKQLLPSAPFPESSKPVIESWFEFVSTDGSESVSFDLWKCLWDFFMRENLINEDAEDHWNSRIDEFMQYYNAKHRSLEKPGNTFKMKSTNQLPTRIWSQDIVANQKYVGLYNQGATCYLNSLLQTLFMTPEFRGALYKSFNNQVSEASTVFQLQKLFAMLQTSDVQKTKAISTRDLTRSFGFSSEDSFTQHDIQELCRVLFDHLETTFRKINVPNFITTLYEGKVKDYVKCKQCNRESQRLDTFLDISLDIHNITSLEQALINFASPEILTEPNAYFCEHCQQKVTALKGLSISQVPPILMFQLKRFVFNIQTMNKMKLNHKVVFPFVLNMNRFVTKESKPNETDSGKAKSVFKPFFDTTDKLFSRAKKNKTDVPDVVAPGVENKQTQPPTTVESLTQEIKALETFLQSDDIDDFSTFLEQIEQKRSQLAALQSQVLNQPSVVAEPKPHFKVTLNATDYLDHSSSQIQSVARLLVHYEKLIAMERESPVRELWEQMLQEKYHELQSLLQGPAPIPKSYTVISDSSTEVTVQDSLKDGPEVYELLSILVHSGSANGGHYYTFIKSFEDNLWYKFNDSSVSQVPVELVKQESFGDKSMGSAYMLVYSRVQPTSVSIDHSIPVPHQLQAAMNRQPFHTPAMSNQQSDQVDSTIGTRMAQAPVDQGNMEEDSYSDGVYDSMEEDSVEPFDFSDDDIVQDIEFQIAFRGINKSIKLSTSDTLQQATLRAYETIILADTFHSEFIPLNCVRLRPFDAIYNIPSRMTLEGKEHSTIHNLGYPGKKKFILETRQEGGKFPEYGPDDWIVQIKQFLPGKNTFSYSLYLAVPHHASVAALKLIIQEQLAIQVGQQRILVTLDRVPSVKVLEPSDDSAPLLSFGVVDGFTFFIEIVGPHSLQLFDSPAMRKLFEETQNKAQQVPTPKHKEPSLKIKTTL